MERLLVALVLTVLLAVGVGVVAGGDEPTAVCPVCDSDGGYHHDVFWTLGVDDPDASHVEVHVREDGSAVWTVRNEWDDPETLEDVRENPEAVEEAVRQELRWGQARTHTDLRTDVGARHIEIEYTLPAFAARERGLLLVRYFHRAGSWQWLNAEELVVHAPDGQVITNTPEGASLSDDRTTATWEGPQKFFPSVYVVTGSDRSLGTRADTRLVTTGAILPVVLDNLAWVVVAPMLVFTGLVAGLSRVGRRVGTPRRTARVPLRVLVGVCTVGVLGLVAFLVWVGASRFVLLLAPLGWIAAVGYSAGTQRRQRVALLGAAVAFALSFVLTLWPALVEHRWWGFMVLSFGVAVGYPLLGIPLYVAGLATGHRAHDELPTP